jgi:hypothetical protein
MAWLGRGTSGADASGWGLAGCGVGVAVVRVVDGGGWVAADGGLSLAGTHPILSIIKILNKKD